MTTKVRRLSRHQELEVAVKASADPRTVRKVVAGEPVRGVARERVERALREMGLCGSEGATATGRQT